MRYWTTLSVSCEADPTKRLHSGILECCNSGREKEETHINERGGIVVRSKTMDIKDGEQEAQRKFMNSEFDNNYDALPLANDAAAKS